METVYLVCALVGGTLLVCQFLLGLLGLGDHHDIGTDHDFHFDHDAGHADAGHSGSGHEHASSIFLSVLTFRTVVAALLFFGLTGLAIGPRMEDTALTFGFALAAGAGAMLAVAWMMKTLYRLKADGTVRINRAVGQTGTVYLTVPARQSGAGKVTLKLQNRTVECQAVTRRDSLPTGTTVVVVGIVAPDTVEVITAPEPEKAHV
jgi:membrane protein implicated in regulation of membrane protease activity